MDPFLFGSEDIFLGFLKLFPLHPHSAYRPTHNRGNPTKSADFRCLLVLYGHHHKRIVQIFYTHNQQPMADTSRNRNHHSDIRHLAYYVLPVEVGARGFVAHSTIKYLSAIGLQANSRRRLVKDVQAAAETASAWIWQSSGT